MVKKRQKDISDIDQKIISMYAKGMTAIAATYPKTEYQRCIVHQVRNTMKYVSDKDRKPFCADIKTIYQAPTEEKALDALERITEKWSGKYPNSMRSRKQNWDAISPIFKLTQRLGRSFIPPSPLRASTPLIAG